MRTTSLGLEFGQAQIWSGEGCVQFSLVPRRAPVVHKDSSHLEGSDEKEGQVSGEQLRAHPIGTPPCRSDIWKPCCAEICGHTTSVLRSFDQKTRGKAGPRNCMVPKSASGGLGADGTVAYGRRSSIVFHGGE